MKISYGKIIDPKKFTINKLSNLQDAVKGWKEIAVSSLIISFLGFLDALVDPVSQLKLAKGHLNKNGYIVIWFPHHDSLSTLVQSDFPDMAIRHLQPSSAKQQFTLKSCATLLGKSGFKPYAFWFFGLDFYEFLNHLILKIQGFDKTDTYKFLMSHLSDFQLVIDEAKKSDGFIVLAKQL